MPKAKLTIDKEIGKNDEYAIVYGYPSTCFSPKDLTDWLEEHSEFDEIEVSISSVGGNVEAGFEIHDLLIASGKKITTIGYKVNSIATIIFMAGSDRRISANASFVPHNPRIDPYALGYEALTADELQAITDEMYAIQEKMLNAYATALGWDDTKKAEFQLIMNEDTDIGATKALEWGLATSIINAAVTKVTAIKTYTYSSKIAAILKDKQKNKITDMDLKDFQKKLDSIATAVKALNDKWSKKEVKASTSSLQDGTVIYFVEDTIAVGIKVYSDEAMTTALTDGPYILTDGSTIEVEGGAITSLEAAEKLKAVEALTKANDELKAKVEALTKALKDKDAEKAAVVAEVKSISDQVKALSEVIPGDGKLPGAGSEDDSFAAKAKEASKLRRFGF